jgi:hypothetical protein
LGKLIRLPASFRIRYGFVSFTAIFKIENPKPLWLKASRVYFF